MDLKFALLVALIFLLENQETSAKSIFFPCRKKYILKNPLTGAYNLVGNGQRGSQGPRNPVAFQHNKKYNILAPISKVSNGYLKSNRNTGADILVANGLGGSDDQNSIWIAKRNPIHTTIYWKFWTSSSTKEIVVTANNTIELQPVSSPTPDEGNLFLPTSLIKKESYYQYHLLQPKSKESEHKYLGVNRDGSMTLVTNIDINPALNPNPQAAFMAFKVED